MKGIKRNLNKTITHVTSQVETTPQDNGYSKGYLSSLARC